MTLEEFKIFSRFADRARSVAMTYGRKTETLSRAQFVSCQYLWRFTIDRMVCVISVHDRDLHVRLIGNSGVEDGVVLSETDLGTRFDPELAAILLPFIDKYLILDDLAAV